MYNIFVYIFRTVHVRFYRFYLYQTHIYPFIYKIMKGYFIFVVYTTRMDVTNYMSCNKVMLYIILKAISVLKPQNAIKHANNNYIIFFENILYINLIAYSISIHIYKYINELKLYNIVYMYLHTYQTFLYSIYN